MNQTRRRKSDDKAVPITVTLYPAALRMLDELTRFKMGNRSFAAEAAIASAYQQKVGDGLVDEQTVAEITELSKNRPRMVG